MFAPLTHIGDSREKYTDENRTLQLLMKQKMQNVRLICFIGIPVRQCRCWKTHARDFIRYVLLT